MASHYTDPRDFVLHIRGELIAEYLKKRYNVDFSVADEKEMREKCADRFMEFINAQKEDLRDKVFMELEYVNALSSENHIAALCALAPSINREEVIEKRSQTYDERALLAFVNFPDEFDDYYSRANIEELGVKELTLPKVAPIADITGENKMREFEDKVQNVYRSLYKGEKCKIKTFPDGDKLLLRAYLENLPTRDIAFEGKLLDEKHIRKPVFDAVFIYKPELKMLGVRALGGKQVVSNLQKLFCSHFLGINNINTDEERYSLASIKDLSNLNLTAEPSYGVERAYLKSIRLKHRDIPHRIFINVGGKEQYTGTDEVQKILKDLGLDKDKGWDAESIKITVVFKQADKGRRKQVSVSITPPNTCNLKNRPQDDIIRKLLKDWGIYVA